MSNDPPISDDPIGSAERLASPISPSNVQMHCPGCGALQTMSYGGVSSCSNCGAKFQLPSSVQPTPPRTPYQTLEMQKFISQRLPAAICGICIGGFGVHKFILGFHQAGIIMLLVSLSGFVGGSCLIFPILGAMAMGIIGMIEGILYLTKTDQEFYQVYAIEKKQWF